jgi:excisionase family DNA binding protein
MSDPISTGAAARILGTSRQHVVNLVNRGVLRRYGSGTHRRVRRADVEALLGSPLSRDARQSLWLHRAVAGRVAADPEAAIARACRNLELMASAAGRRSPWLARWEEVLAAGPERVLRVLTDADSPLAVELRQNSPFAGLLSEAERRLLLEAFRRVDAGRA